MQTVNPWLLSVALFALLGSSADADAAEAPYPQRPVRLIIPQATGGGSDTIGRFVMQRLGDNLGQAFVVDNRPGAAGMLGAELVKQATPDGYTMLLRAIDTITAPIVSRRAPFDAIRDFSPITQMTQSPNVWLVNLSFPAQSMKDLVELAKTKPNQIDYASSGVGSMQHLGGELFNRMARVQLSHVPYKGGPPGLVDVLGGRVPVIVSGFQGALPYIKAGKLRALAVTTPKRAPAIPDVPTVAETTCPNHDTIGGCCSVEMNFIRDGRRTHSCRANFIHELSKFEMGEANIVSNVNFFMSVPVGQDGHMAISESPSRAGDFVDVEALTDVIAVISNCPQKYNPACGYKPTPVRVETYTRIA